MYHKAYRYDHAVVLFDGTATSEERYEEDYDADDYHQNGNGEEPVVDEITVSFVTTQYNGTDGDEDHPGYLQSRSMYRIL